MPAQEAFSSVSGLFSLISSVSCTNTDLSAVYFNPGVGKDLHSFPADNIIDELINHSNVPVVRCCCMWGLSVLAVVSCMCVCMREREIPTSLRYCSMSNILCISETGGAGSPGQSSGLKGSFIRLWQMLQLGVVCVCVSNIMRFKAHQS